MTPAQQITIAAAILMIDEQHISINSSKNSLHASRATS